MKLCKHQRYCKKNHEYVPCPQKGCIWGRCETCDIWYNPLFDCSKL